MDIQRQRAGDKSTADAGSAIAQPDRRLNLARWMYWSREIRPPTGAELYGEPAWDLLLDLYLRQKSGTRSSITSACIGARAPHTTALRYVGALCEAGWLERIVDETDRRRNWLALTPLAEARLDRYFDRLLATMEVYAGDRLRDS